MGDLAEEAAPALLGGAALEGLLSRQPCMQCREGEGSLCFSGYPAWGPVGAGHVGTYLQVAQRRGVHLVPGRKREGSFLGPEEQLGCGVRMRLCGGPVRARSTRGCYWESRAVPVGRRGCVWDEGQGPAVGDQKGTVGRGPSSPWGSGAQSGAGRIVDDSQEGAVLGDPPQDSRAWTRVWGTGHGEQSALGEGVAFPRS